jgi:dynein heavy chain
VEANDNSRYLKSLKNLFEQLEDPGRDFMTTHELFIPTMHTILLIWTHSKYYKSPPRLVVLIREICNAIISKAREFASGETIFSLIKSDEPQEAYQKL